MVTAGNNPPITGDSPEEACGVFGIFAPGQDVARYTYFGLHALQHRGQESAGIAIHTLALAAVKATRSGQVAYQGEQLPALQGVRLADGEPATLLTLRDSMCKWPIGDPADPKFAFCGRKADCGPYCAEHAKVAFQPARKRDSKRGEYDYVRRIAG